MFFYKKIVKKESSSEEESSDNDSSDDDSDDSDEESDEWECKLNFKINLNGDLCFFINVLFLVNNFKIKSFKLFIFSNS